MNTISRRSFLKMLGAGALTVAGASVLSGCSMTSEVTVSVLVNGIPYSETKKVKLPFFLTSLPKKTALKLVKENVPAQYKDYTIELDDKQENNCKIVKDKDGNRALTIAVKASKKS